MVDEWEWDIALLHLHWARTVDEDMPVSAVAADELAWIVIVGRDGRPKAALPPGDIAQQPADQRVGDLVAQLPELVVAEDGTTAQAVLEKAAELQLGSTAPIVVMTPARMRNPAEGDSVSGVLTLGELRRSSTYEWKIGDARLEPVVTVDEHTAVAAVTANVWEQWVVILGARGEPKAALPLDDLVQKPGHQTVGELVATLPPIILAEDGAGVHAVLDLAAEFELRPTTPVVVVTSPPVLGGPPARRVSGVLTVEELRRRSPSMRDARYSGTLLPGPVRIPQIVRHCNYHEANMSCGLTEYFRTKPAQMPACVNPQSLSAHKFVW